MDRRSLLIDSIPLLVVALALAACLQPTPSKPTEAPAAAVEGERAEGGTQLAVTGLVGNELSLSMSDLQGLDVVEKSIEHPKEGKQTYSGVTLPTLIDEADPAEDATLTFTASDAYSVDVPVPEADACSECMIAFKEGSLRLIMPGFGSSFWVKDLVSVEAH